MIVRSLDTDNDWTFGKGVNNYKVGNAAVAQCIQTRLSSFIGDCFFDAGAGVNWLEYCAGFKSQTIVNLAVAAVILNTPGGQNGSPSVTGILQISVNLNSATRGFSVSYRAQSIYSQVNNTFSYDLGGSA